MDPLMNPPAMTPGRTQTYNNSASLRASAPRGRSVLTVQPEGIRSARAVCPHCILLFLYRLSLFQVFFHGYHVCCCFPAVLTHRNTSFLLCHGREDLSFPVCRHQPSFILYEPEKGNMSLSLPDTICAFPVRVIFRLILGNSFLGAELTFLFLPCTLSCKTRRHIS